LGHPLRVLQSCIMVHFAHAFVVDQINRWYHLGATCIGEGQGFVDSWKRHESQMNT